MSDSDKLFDTKRQFIDALARHYGLPDGQVMVGSCIEGDGELYSAFEVVFRVAITPEDLMAAAAIMGGALPKPRTVTVQLDTEVAMTVLAKALEPGAVLLSPEAVRNLQDLMGAGRTDAEMKCDLIAIGGIFATNADDFSALSDYILKNSPDGKPRLREDGMPLFGADDFGGMPG